MDDENSKSDERRDYESAVECPSKLSQRVRALKDRAFEAAEVRKKLPQTLFWSLFLGEVGALKKEKDRIRAEKKDLFGVK